MRTYYIAPLDLLIARIGCHLSFLLSLGSHQHYNSYSHKPMVTVYALHVALINAIHADGSFLGRKAKILQSTGFLNTRMCPRGSHILRNIGGCAALMCHFFIRNPKTGHICYKKYP